MASLGDNGSNPFGIWKVVSRNIRLNHCKTKIQAADVQENSVNLRKELANGTSKKLAPNYNQKGVAITFKTSEATNERATFSCF